MDMKTNVVLCFVTVCMIVILMLSSVSPVNSLPLESDNPCSGPIVDKVIYREISDPDEQMFALQAGDIDAIFEGVDPVNVDTLEMDPDIAIHSQPSHEFGEIIMNCYGYPTNISGLRRAFAYAFDKTGVVTEVKENHAFEHDSIILNQNILCAEESLPWHYYAAQPEKGNAILDSLNFSIDSGTNYRLAPDGAPFEILVSYATVQTGADEIAQKAVDALLSLQIDARLDEYDFVSLYSNLDNHGSFDMIVMKRSRQLMRDLQWILNNFHSTFADVPFHNPSAYMNDTFDSIHDDVLNANTEEEFFDAVTALQVNLHENVPVLIAYQDIEYIAYRTTDFTGHVEDDFWGLIGPWTNLNVHRTTRDAFGGVFEIAYQWAYEYLFNIFLSYHKTDFAMINNLYSSLYKIGPDGVAYPDIAEEVVVETHMTNSSVPEGETWITVKIKDGLVWSDGRILDAEDVANTFTYISESEAWQNPKAQEWGGDFLSSEALSSDTARIILSRDSYYHIQNMLTVEIIPEHIFNPTHIGYDEWIFWEPVITSDPHVTSGPFYLSNHGATFFEFSRNTDYHWPSILAPRILSADNVTYVQGTTGNQIFWDASDEDPLNYTIFQDSSLLVTDDWTGSNVSRNVDGLDVGTYNFTILLRDMSGNSVTNTIWVTVIPTEYGPPGNIQDILIIGTIVGSVIVIIGATVLICKKKK